MSIRQLASKRRVESSPEFSNRTRDANVVLSFDNGISDLRGSDWAPQGAGVRTTSVNARSGQSLLLDGAIGSWLSTTNTGALNVSANFTIEMWVRPGALTGTFQILLITAADTGTAGQQGYAIALGNNAYTWSFVDYNAQTTTTASTPLVANTWQHIAICRSGTTLRMFQNGTVVSTTTNGSGFQNATNVAIGAAATGVSGAGSRRFNGMIDSLIVEPDNARYTANFTPSTRPIMDAFSPADARNDALWQNNSVVNWFEGTSGTATFPNMIYGNHDRFWNNASGVLSNTPVPVQGSTALSLNGTNARLFTNRSESLSFGTSDFTVEMWVRPTNTTGDQCIFDCRHDGQEGFAIYSSARTAALGALGTAANGAWGYVTNTGLANYGAPLSLTAWTHIAIVREGNFIRGYENGVLRFTQPENRSFSLAPRYVLGQASNLSHWYNGGMDLLRITRGVARYPNGVENTLIFTPPTALNFLGPMDDVRRDAVTSDIDFGRASGIVSDRASRAEWSLLSGTNVSNGVVTTAGGGSGITTNALEASLFSLTGNFCVEMIIRPQQIQSTATTLFVNCADSGGASGISIYIPANTLEVAVFNYPTSTEIARSNIALSTQFDNHVAVTRVAGQLRIFINGIESASVANATSWAVGSQVRVLCNTAANSSFVGTCSQFKLTNSRARYVSRFIPQVSRVDPFIENVTSLIHFEGANASTRINDSRGRLWAAVGNAQITSNNQLSGVGSLLLDGSGDSITSPINTDAFSFPADFTIEFWILPNLTSYANNKTLWDNSINANGNPGLNIGLRETNVPYLYDYQSGQFVIQSPTPLVQNTWTHVAVSRSDTITRLFVNGVLVGSTTSLRQDIINNSTINVGGHSTAGAQFSFSGQMDEIRVTKGVGRYTENFRPVRGMFPDI